MKVASRWFLPGLCVSVPLALFVLFTYIYPRPYYVFETDIEPDYYYNARLVLDGQPTGLHHPGTLIYYLGALVLKMTGTELDHTQQFLNACYLVVAAASIGGLLIFWRRLLQDMPLGIGALTLVLAMAWPTWLNYSNYFGADSFTLAVGLPVSALLWRLFATPHHKSWWLFALTGASLGLALSIKMTFVPFVAAAFGGVGIGQLLQSGSTWTGATGKLSRAIQRTLQMTVGLVVSFIICITPAWAKALAVWYQTFRRPDVKTAGFGAIPALGDAAHLLFEANPLLTLLFASVSVWFVFTVIKRHLSMLIFILSMKKYYYRFMTIMI